MNTEEINMYLPKLVKSSIDALDDTQLMRLKSIVENEIEHRKQSR